MKTINIGILGVDTLRTRAYLSCLLKDQIRLEQAILLENGAPKISGVAHNTTLFDSESSSIELLNRMSTNVTLLNTNNINDPGVEETLNQSAVNIFIYSGSGGAIIRDNILKTGKQFLHIHPGYLPDYKGSTTIYYSLLQEQSCGAAAILIDNNIDTGPLVIRRKFDPPEDWSTIDHEYDPFIRSQVLSEVITKYMSDNKFTGITEQDPHGHNYYIMHPLLRHLTILSQPSNLIMEN